MTALTASARGRCGHPSGERPIWVRVLPVAIALGYLSLSVVLFRFGPWPWPVAHPYKLYIFLALAHAALLLGYLSGVRAIALEPRRRYLLRRLIAISAFAGLAVAIPLSLNRTGQVVPQVLAGLADPGAAYASGHRVRGGFAIGEYMAMVLMPFMAMVLPLTVYYLDHLSVRLRCSAVLSVGATASAYVASGTVVYIANVAVLVPVLLLARRAAGRSQPRRGRVVVGGLVVAALCAFGVAFFSAGQATRPGAAAVKGFDATPGVVADWSNPFLRAAPVSWRPATLALFSYLTQGYYGLSLCLDEPYVPTFGFGNSMFLYLNASTLPFLEDLEERPYPIRAEAKGWDAYGRWSTFYAWVASDVTFPGAIVLMALIGRVLSATWIDTLDGRNPMAVAMFAQLVILLMYLPANNQVGQSGGSLVAFVGILMLWLRARGRRRRRWVVGGPSGGGGRPISSGGGAPT